MFKRWAASWWRFVMRQVAHANTKTNAVLGWAGNFQLLLVVGAWAFAAWVVALGLPFLLGGLRIPIPPLLRTPYWNLTVGFVLVLLLLEIGAKGAWQEEDRALTAEKHYADSIAPTETMLRKLRELLAQGKILDIQGNQPSNPGMVDHWKRLAEDWKNRVVAELPRSGPLRSAFSRVSPTIGLVYPAQPGSPFTHVAFQDVRLKACVDGLQIIIDQIEAGGDHAHD